MPVPYASADGATAGADLHHHCAALREFAEPHVPPHSPASMLSRGRRPSRPTPGRGWRAIWPYLMNMRYADALIETLLQGVTTRGESVLYQKIIRQGKAEGEISEARKMLLLQGRSRFGEPPPEAVAALDALSDVSRLEELGVRLLSASSWQELLGLNGSGSRRQRTAVGDGPGQADRGCTLSGSVSDAERGCHAGGSGSDPGPLSGAVAVIGIIIRSSVGRSGRR